MAVLVYALGEDLDIAQLRSDIRLMDRAYLKRQREMRELERSRAERATKLRGAARGTRR